MDDKIKPMAEPKIADVDLKAQELLAAIEKYATDLASFENRESSRPLSSEKRVARVSSIESLKTPSTIKKVDSKRPEEEKSELEIHSFADFQKDTRPNHGGKK